MDQENTFENLRALLAAAELCISSKLLLPSLALLYCVVDIGGWLLSSNSDVTVQQSFTAWLDRYVLPNDSLPCTSLDLYAARCGLLHSNAPDSRLSDQGRAKRIAYAWGDADVTKLRASIQREGRQDLVGVHVDDLYRLVKLGVENFIADVQRVLELRQQVEQRATRAFAPLSKELLDGYLDLTGPGRSDHSGA